MENTIGIDWRDWIRRSMPQIVIGAVIGAGTLALALRHIDWSGVGNALRNTRPSMALAALLLTFVTLVLSVTRWWLLFTPEHHERNWWVLAGAIVIGQTANVVLPGRVGEIARMFLVGTRERVSKARVAATIVVEKVTDLAVFAVFTGYVLVAMTLPSWMMRSGTALTVTSALLVLVILGLSFWSGALLRVVEAIARHLPERWGRRLIALSEAALDGLRSLRDWRAGLAIWFLAATIL
ncbi:MAG TPA: lysylphosphatidylglycerol synthase transmembrane domain-containing protein, partial [Gemmatimonadaceae bacterium]|nr:lysylphosphatidylglycerol synthase transmembrane domain-containing protein [Gemmatimonadaceae bacterium]